MNLIPVVAAHPGMTALTCLTSHLRSAGTLVEDER